MTVKVDKQTAKQPGTVRIQREVLASIVQAATLEVEGVIRMGNAHETFRNRLFSRDYNGGVKIEVKEDRVYADLYIIVNKDVNMAKVGKQVQGDVSRAIREVVGMPVEQVNVYIQNVE